MIGADTLRTVPVLRTLPSERVEWLARTAEDVALSPGELLLKQGDASSGVYIILEGEVLLLREQGGRETLAGRRVPPSFLGEISTLTGHPVTATCRAQTPCRLIRLDQAVFFELLGCCTDFARTIFRTMVDRTMETDGIIGELEKMASLGTLAAGLAHELNNPAAAAVRALDSARERAAALARQSLAADRDAAGAAAIGRLLDAVAARPAPEARSGLDAADAEEVLADWLAARGVPDAWDVAPVLTAAGIAADDLVPLESPDDPAAFAARVRRVADNLDLAGLLSEAATACTRMSDLVAAVKSYSYMDRETRQVGDIHKGIEDTLTILKHRWPEGVAIDRRFDRTIPAVTAYGSELNQVWTNLLMNALDAVGGRGTITITTRRDGDYAVVVIGDDGPGIPADLQHRVFDPFYTTKPVGKGTGLGLDIAQRIVVARHCGTMSLQSQPGDTRFEVAIPIEPPDMQCD